ncbi:hypothetical protein FE697_010875 [Mumia zhuanghuii]|uniref:Proline rich protein n=2 Tax=Mumia TaxID=1546255 RepID=A0ABW1QFQ8_9ACTN|nr:MULTISPECIES: hypothetical protein [Mumia]KAA1422678.1 hypothetical protein FE697_010875 [Mumia zhuanghuii]
MSDPQNPPGGEPNDGQPGSTPSGGEPPSGPPPYEPPPGPPGGYPPPPPQGPPPQGPPPQGPPPGGYGPPPQGPPPGGGYGQPPQGPPGGYGPPPGGGYPPPPGGYGPPPGYTGGPEAYGEPPALSVGDAISYGWNKFKANWAVWVVITLIFFVIQAVIGGIGTAAQSGSDSAMDNGVWAAAGGFSFLALLFNLLNTLVSWLMQAAQTKGALAETEGRKPGIGDFFQWGDRAGAVILTFLLLAVLSFVGFLLCILPGIIFTFFAWYTLWFVLDQRQSPIDALQSSFKLVGNNLGPIFLLALALIGINILGAILCLVGLLVTVPLTLLATGYSYKFLTRQPIG